MQKIVMYVMAGCPYCTRAEALLRKKQAAPIDIIWVDREPAKKAQMIQITGRRTVPQIFIGAQHVGGCDDLYALDAAGELEPLLASLQQNL